MIQFIWPLEKAKLVRLWKGQCFQALGGEEGWINEAKEIYVSKSILYDTVMVDIWNYALSKTVEIYSIKNEP